MRALALLAALALAGCLTASEEVTGPALDATAAAALQGLPLEATGKASAYACVWVVVVGNCPVLAENDDLVELAAPGEVRALDAEITWTSAHRPGAPVHAWLYVDRGDGWEHEDGEDPEEMGDAPLKVAWNLTAYAGHPLALVVYSMDWRGAVVGGAGVATPAEFAVKGTIEYAADADATVDAHHG